MILLSIYTYTVCIYKYTYIRLASSIRAIPQLGSPNASSDLRPASGRAALRENLKGRLPTFQWRMGPYKTILSATSLGRLKIEP